MKAVGGIMLVDRARSDQVALLNNHGAPAQCIAAIDSIRIRSQSLHPRDNRSLSVRLLVVSPIGIISRRKLLPLSLSFPRWLSSEQSSRIRVHVDITCTHWGNRGRILGWSDWRSAPPRRSARRSVVCGRTRRPFASHPFWRSASKTA